ncbi:MAG: serine/threonine protein kinase, partial [Methanomicrobiales archaeon]|nr:serine/threonine protein kinase [Methanomicrobiales archaeon]
FMKEIRVWEDLRHPNIVEVTAVNILPIPYVEMEYLERSLDRCRKPMALPVAIRIMQGIAEGLSYAHHRGVIHRDLKPHNILLGDNLTPKIADWGLSRGLSDDTAASVSGYSLPYASPEQISPRQFGSTGPWTDLYQLGVIMYELIFGVLPFGGEGLYETGTAILSAPPAPAVVPAEVTPILPVILRCLEKEPSARYQSAEEFLDDLARHFGS